MRMSSRVATRRCRRRRREMAMPVCDSDAMLSVPALSAPIMASETSQVLDA